MKKYLEKQLHIKTFELTRSPKVAPESNKIFFYVKTCGFFPNLLSINKSAFPEMNVLSYRKHMLYFLLILTVWEL